MITRTRILCCLIVFSIASCIPPSLSDEFKKGPDNEDKNREELLRYTADSVIIPAYDQFKGSFDAMLAASIQFNAQPSLATLQQFRATWATAYTDWQRVELFDVGPAEAHSIRFYFNIYPANVASITKNFANPTADLELPASYPNQGFPALDYLLNGIDTTDEAIIATYTTAPDAAAKLAYINRITTRMNELLLKVVGDWKATGRDAFIANTGTAIGSSLSSLINGYIMHYERYIRSGKFGIPSGALLAGTEAPEKVEAFYKKDLSLTLAKAAHQAAIDLFNGKNTLNSTQSYSFKTYLDALGAKDATSGKMLSAIINEQFEVCNGQLNTLNANLYQEVLTNNQAMKTTFTTLQKTVRLLKVDMSSAMSITITFTDNDGD